jgi:hypothetical protein
MTRLAVIMMTLAITSLAQAMPLAPAQPDGLTTTIRMGCGLGYQRVAGRCVRNTAVRTVRRCARGRACVR